MVNFYNLATFFKQPGLCFFNFYQLLRADLLRRIIRSFFYRFLDILRQPRKIICIHNYNICAEYMVCLDPVFTYFVKRIIQRVNHGVFLPVNRMLLQSCIYLVHSQRSRCRLHPVPCFQIHLKVRRPQLKALEIIYGCHRLCRRYNPWATESAAKQLESCRIANCFFQLPAYITLPSRHKMVIVIDQERCRLNICNRCKGCQCANGFDHYICYAIAHAFQNLRGAAKACAAVQFDRNLSVCQFFDFFFERCTCIVSVITFR